MPGNTYSVNIRTAAVDKQSGGDESTEPLFAIADKTSRRSNMANLIPHGSAQSRDHPERLQKQGKKDNRTAHVGFKDEGRIERKKETRWLTFILLTSMLS